LTLNRREISQLAPNDSRQLTSSLRQLYTNVHLVIFTQQHISPWVQSLPPRQGREGLVVKTVSKVLLVDDEPHIRRIGELSLKGVGKWQTLLAASGAEAIEIAERERPDLILLDVMMPGMDGPATLQQLRASDATAKIPVIFMTAKVQKHEIDKYLAAGAVGVIPKPFDPMALPAQILRILSSTSE
jgi:CheY-like chemotaxis protein